MGALTGVDYRVTARDVKGDGSVLKRLTWRNQKYDEPAPVKKAFHEYTYTMRRLMDDQGNVDKSALKAAKSIYGENVVFLGAAW